MAKRDIEIEPAGEDFVEPDVPSVGDRLREAREAKKLSLDDIAAQTRIPRRHLENLEKSEWDQLPAPTYTMGFAKSYASAVDLDRTDIGDQLRAEMGGQRFTANAMETFEPADPRRTMPKGLVIGTVIAVVVLIALMSWLNQRSLQPDETASPSAGQAPVAAGQPAIPQAAPAPAPRQGVVINATDTVWLEVYEKGGATLFSGMLQPGQSFTVPPSSTAPLLKTGKPEALNITVGNQPAPAVGRPAQHVNDVSLLPADLLKNGAAPTPATAQTAPPAPAPSPRPVQRRRPQAAAPPPAPAATPEPAAPEPAPPTTNTSG
jgi:cytoskeletal protein RodZ